MAQSQVNEPRAASPSAKEIQKPVVKKEEVAHEEEDDGTVKVFVGNLPFSTTDETLKEYFAGCGDVVGSSVIKRYGRSKGYGFVSFATEKEAQSAVLLDKSDMEGRTINCEIARKRIPDSERPPRPERAPRGGKRVGRGGAKSTSDRSRSRDNNDEEKKVKPTRNARKGGEPEGEPSEDVLFIGNLPYKVTDEELKQIFSQYEVTTARVVALHNGRSKGFGFVHVVNKAEQQKILAELQGVQVNGRELIIKVAKASQTPRPAKEAAAEEEN
jgi:RNA recognition motif-containing protein